jgi:hypothetical protein
MRRFMRFEQSAIGATARAWPWAVATIVLAGVAAIACVGGGGRIDDAMTTWDPASPTQERADKSSEGAPPFNEGAPASQESMGASAEPGPGAQGGGGVGAAAGFDCSGTYTCQEAGDDDLDTVVLTSANGVCSIPAGKSTSLVLATDGTLLLNGKAVGSWQPTADGFTATTSEGQITCTKGGSAGNSSGAATSNPNSGAGASTGSGSSTTPSPGVDAGR